LAEQTADAPAEHGIGEDVLRDEGVNQRHTPERGEAPAQGNPPPPKNQARGGRGQKAGTRDWYSA
jgi:hypothetical protein